MNGKIVALTVAIIFPIQYAEAQQVSPYRIGFLSPASTSSMGGRVEALRQGLRELGLIEGRNITIEYRWAEGKDERLPSLVAELMGLNVGLVVTHGVLATLAVRKASSTIPIVCFTCGDLVSTKVVSNLARPGGNITGMTSIHPETSGKRLELLKELLPKLKLVAVLYNSDNPVSEPELRSTEAAGRHLGLRLTARGVKGPGEFEEAFSSFSREGAGGLVILSDAMFHGRINQIATLAIANRLPVVTAWGAEFTKAGGLVGYGPDGFAIAHRAASHVDKILKGAKAGDLPVEQPTKFELVINLKAAKAIGLTVPSPLIARADDVVE